MKKFRYILVGILLWACDGENTNDCFQASGSMITETFSVPFFSKIRIEDDVSLIIRQGNIQQVSIETGDNLLNDVSVEVKDEVLIIKDNNRCNLVRDYGITRAIVTTPDLKEIRNSSEYDVIGQGVLVFPSLRLVSNTTEGIEGSRKSGDFTMTISCNEFVIEANGFSGFFIDGTSEKATFSFEDEIPRLEAANLIAKDVFIFQRSANKMIVHPVERLKGVIRGTGDVIAVHRPPVVEVEQFYTGQLLFED